VRALSASATVLSLAVLAATPGVAGSVTPTASVGPSAAVPPGLQALEVGMEQLQITSERYSRKVSALLSVTEEESSSSSCQGSTPCQLNKPVRRVTHRKTRFTLTQTGEVDVAAKAANLSLGDGTKQAPLLVETGSFAYTYLPGTATPRGRPWVREVLDSAQAHALFSTLFPFHGREPGVASHGATGPYAGLIDLLASAHGGVSTVGGTVVNGQPTTEFVASVVPNPDADRTAPIPLPPSATATATEKLQVFLAGSGLPLRVIATLAAGGTHVSTTTDILAVNVPVHVKPPPIRRTISAARFRKLSRESNESSSSSRTEAVGPSQSTQ
jgi:hypothetical protein